MANEKNNLALGKTEGNYTPATALPVFRMNNMLIYPPLADEK